jgi:multidrug efflux system membrane fusion protein
MRNGGIHVTGVLVEQHGGQKKTLVDGIGRAYTKDAQRLVSTNTNTDTKMSNPSRRRFLACALLLPILALGCDRKQAAAPPRTAPEVTISLPIEKKITDYVEFTGRTDATESVEIRARVSGYLQKVAYTPGPNVEVKKGQLLFVIDPSIYETDWERTKAEVDRAEARLKRLDAELSRAKDLFSKNALSKDDYDKAVGDRDETAAAIKSTKASADRAKLDLDFTKVLAPINGKIGRPLITEGNLVNANVTVLTTIVASGQMHVYFDVDENAFRAYKDAIREGKIKAANETEGLAELRWRDGTVFPKHGTIDFQENQINTGTATLRVRALFPDPDGVLTSGEFVRIRLPKGEPRRAMLIPESAVGSDQGQNYVWVVDADNKVSYRRVKLGTIHDGFQVVESGLKPDEWIIVNGLQRVRDGVTVTPKKELADDKQSAK